MARAARTRSKTGGGKRRRTTSAAKSSGWCSEFSKLQKLLEKDSNELIIERALGVRVILLAEISIYDADESAPEVADHIRARSLGDGAW